MKQTIEIEVPDGKKAVWKDNKVVFEDIKPKLPKTWEEFCSYNHIKKDEVLIGVDCDIFKAGKKSRNIYEDCNILPSRKAAEQHLALMQLHQLRDCYRQGWVPNWKDFESNKYCIIFIDYKYVIVLHNTASSFLSFQSREIAEEFLNNFKDLIEQAGDLI